METCYLMQRVVTCRQVRQQRSAWLVVLHQQQKDGGASLFLENLSVFTGLNRQAGTDRVLHIYRAAQDVKTSAKTGRMYRWTTAKSGLRTRFITKLLYMYHKFHQLYS